MHVLATAGHVDHGKSALVKALTGMEPDRFAEERRRGMTLDLGFAWSRLPSGATVAFVDVPGHERFVSTMLAGVGPVPAVLFVVAAEEGWMPQSTEHLDALVAFGVRHGLLVISRSDLADPAPALADARAHLAATPLAAVPAVAVSATAGSGMAELRRAIDQLVTTLPAASTTGDVRLWVDRAFTITGAGTVVTGTLGAGRIRVGDKLELATATGLQPVAVRALHSLGVAHTEVDAVSRVAINLRGTRREAVARGDALLTPGAWRTTALFDARIRGRAADLPTELQMHIGAVAVAARLRPIGADTVRLQLHRPLPLRIGDVAVLRDPGRHRIPAGLTVLDVAPPPMRRRGAAARRATELSDLDGVPDARAELRRRGIARAADLTAMGALATDLDVPGTGGWLLDTDHAERLASRLAAAVAAHDAADPLQPGLSTAAAARALELPDLALVAAVVGHAGERHGLLLRAGKVTRSRDHGVPAVLRGAVAALRADLGRDPFAAPDADRLAALGLGSRELAALTRAGVLLRVDDAIVLLPGADALAVQRLAALGPEFTVSAARQALGTSRRVALPLLELLARTGRATRTTSGNHRLLPAPSGSPESLALP